jgi:hypothetical protein
LTTSSGSMSSGPSDRKAFDDTLAKLLKTFENNYLIIREDLEHFNLANDYIVRPILDATTDIDPVEARANRLLEQYLTDERRDRRITIPLHHLRFINKYGTVDRRVQPAAARLLQRSKRRLATRAAIAAVAAAMLLATALMPPRFGFQVQND